ncbi:MAG: 7-cyano-7-deazaguanine synthase QueC [bacterium]
MSYKKKAIVLLSGGLDSGTLLYWAKQKFTCTAITFDYGQKHKKEITYAKKIAHKAGCPWMQIKLYLPVLKSSLTDARFTIPRGDSRRAGKKKIPSTYVPGRNTIFLSYAVSLAESWGCTDVCIGANAVDYSGYPDCRPDYIKAMQYAACLGTKTGREGNPIHISAPLIRKTKAEIITLGRRLHVPFDLTWSCYRGGEKPCGKCDACILREKGFKEAG